jgi:hypothetical protein
MNLDLKENPFQNSRAVVKSDENSSETKQLHVAQQNITK